MGTKREEFSVPVKMKVSGLSKGLFLVQLFAATVLGDPSKTPLYKDVNAPVEKRVEDLLGRMTVEDKMAQLMQGMFLRWFNSFAKSDKCTN